MSLPWSVCFFPLPLLPMGLAMRLAVRLAVRLAMRLSSWSVSSVSPSISRILRLIAAGVVCLAALLCSWCWSRGVFAGISVLFFSCVWWTGRKSNIHSWLYGKVFLRFNQPVAFLLQIKECFDSFSPDLLCLRMEQLLFIFTQVKCQWCLEVNK